MNSDEQKENLTKTKEKYRERVEQANPVTGCPHVRAGTPRGVHGTIPANDFSKEEVRDYSDTSYYKRSEKKVLGNYKRPELSEYQEQVSKVSTEETSQENPFNPPAGKFVQFFKNLFFDCQLGMAHAFLPPDYEIVETKPLDDIKKFFKDARDLWTEYEAVLGRRNETVTVLQLNVPAGLIEEEDDAR